MGTGQGEKKTKGQPCSWKPRRKRDSYENNYLNSGEQEKEDQKDGFHEQRSLIT